jgi:hypothetical protein
MQQFTDTLGSSDAYQAPQPKKKVAIPEGEAQPLPQPDEAPTTSYEAGVASARLDEGKLGWFDTVEEEAYYKQVQSAPDYKDNERFYNAYAQAGETIGIFSNKDLHRRKYTRAIADQVFELDNNGELVEGAGHFFGADLLYDVATMKGFLLAQRNGWNEDSLKKNYQEVMKTKKDEINKVTKETFSNIGGNLVGYLVAPETVTDFASPSKVMGSTIGKGALKAFGIESLFVAAGETQRERKRQDHANMLNEDRGWWDGTQEILINSGFAGAIRGIGSAIVDARTMNKIHSNIEDVTDKQIFARYAQRENFKLTNNSIKHQHIMDTAEQQLDEGKQVDVAQHLDKDIKEKFDNEETINFVDELKNDPEIQKDVQFKQALDNEIDEALTEETDINFVDEDFMNEFDMNDARLLNDEEAQLLIKEIEELDTGSAEYGKMIEEAEAAQQVDTKFKAKTMFVGNEEISKTDFDLIKKYQNTREWNRNNPDKKRQISPKQKAAYDKHSNIADDLKDMDFTEGEALPIFSKFADNLAAGTVAGVEVDEDGNINFDPEKFVIGLGGYTAAKKLLPDLFKNTDTQKGISVGSTGGGDVPKAVQEASQEIDKLQGDKNFKEWFKDSKVVDEDGEPLVVYHGTRQDFKTFEADRNIEGIWFSNDADVASSYANYGYRSKKEKKNTRASVMPVYLDMKNPKVVTDFELKKSKVYNPQELLEKIVSDAKKKGHDGVLFKDIDDNLFPDIYGVHLSDNYVVFKPTQIKSIYNKGTFSKNDANILKSITAVGIVGLETQKENGVRND